MQRAFLILLLLLTRIAFADPPIIRGDGRELISDDTIRVLTQLGSWIHHYAADPVLLRSHARNSELSHVDLFYAPTEHSPRHFRGPYLTCIRKPAEYKADIFDVVSGDWFARSRSQQSDYTYVLFLPPNETFSGPFPPAEDFLVAHVDPHIASADFLSILDALISHLGVTGRTNIAKLGKGIQVWPTRSNPEEASFHSWTGSSTTRTVRLQRNNQSWTVTKTTKMIVD